jgi:Uma2 family endonuclease
MIQLDINLVRIPDVSFISWDRVPGDEFPEEPVPLLVPDLAVEVISRGNTPKEMDEKLREYFDRGVRLVWFVRPRPRVVDVYTAPDRFTRLTASATLDGGEVLPGFSVQVGELFRLPKRPGGSKGQPKKNGAQPGKKKGPKRGR